MAATRRRKQAGFTLIEVLVTAVVLGIGLVGVSAMITYGAISHKQAALYTIATARANKELERVRQAGYLSAIIDDNLFPPPTYTHGTTTHAHFAVSDLPSGTGVIYIEPDTQALAINPDTGLAYGNMKRVRVTVSWGGSRRLRGTYAATTLISNRP